jgi:hypothetical protein
MYSYLPCGKGKFSIFFVFHRAPELYFVFSNLFKIKSDNLMQTIWFHVMYYIARVSSCASFRCGSLLIQDQILAMHAMYLQTIKHIYVVTKYQNRSICMITPHQTYNAL